MLSASISARSGWACSLSPICRWDLKFRSNFFRPDAQERVRVSGTVRYRALYLYGIEFIKDADQDQVGRTGAGRLASRQAHS